MLRRSLVGPLDRRREAPREPVLLDLLEQAEVVEVGAGRRQRRDLLEKAVMQLVQGRAVAGRAVLAPELGRLPGEGVKFVERFAVEIGAGVKERGDDLSRGDFRLFRL